MSTASMEYEPDENEQAVLEVLREEGRANPYLIRERIDLRKEYVSKALTGLVKAGVVEKVTRGLYDHVPENDDEFDQEDDVEELRARIAELEAQIESAREWGEATLEALERVDGEDAAENARATVEALEGTDER